MESSTYLFGKQENLQSKKQIAENIYNFPNEKKIVIQSKVFLPQSPLSESQNGRETTVPTNKACLVIPGWGLRVDTKTMAKQSQNFADEFKTMTFALTTEDHSKRKQEGSLDLRADGIIQFLQGLKQQIPESDMQQPQQKNERDQKILNVKLFGHSQGGSLAAIVAGKIAQEEETLGIHVELVGLLSSVSMYDQPSFGMSVRNTADTAAHAPFTAGKRTFGKLVHEINRGRLGNAFQRAKQTGQVDGLAQFGADITPQAIKEVFNLPKFINDMQEIAKKTAWLDKIKAPVIIVQGSNDPISSLEKLAPVERLSLQIVPKDMPDRLEILQTNRNAMRENTKQVQTYLQENVFKNASCVKYLQSRKLGHHGDPMLRTMARAIRGTFERVTREQNTKITSAA